MRITSNSLRRFWSAALLVTAEILTFALPITVPTSAAAQFFEFPFFEHRRRSYQPREQWNPWRHRHQPQRERSPGIDASNAPPPRKQDTPPTMRVVVMGDTMAEWLAYGLEEAFAETPELGVIRKHRSVSGLIRSETRNEPYDWPQAAREIVATEKPDFIVMMIGHADRVAIRERRAAAQQRQTGQRPGGQPAQASPTPSVSKAADPQNPSSEPPSEQRPGDSPPLEERAAPSAPEPAGPAVNYEFRSEKWADLYAKRVDETVAALKTRGVPVFWVGLPAIRGTRATSDMVYLNDIFRGRAEKAGVAYVDVWDGLNRSSSAQDRGRARPRRRVRPPDRSCHWGRPRRPTPTAGCSVAGHRGPQRAIRSQPAFSSKANRLRHRAAGRTISRGRASQDCLRPPPALPENRRRHPRHPPPRRNPLPSPRRLLPRRRRQNIRPSGRPAREGAILQPGATLRGRQDLFLEVSGRSGRSSGGSSPVLARLPSQCAPVRSPRQ